MGGSVLAKCLVSLGLLLGAAAGHKGPNPHKRPNIVFVITDDQDLHMNTLEHMPNLQKHLVKEGTSYSNHFCTIALCCPSRVNLLTGKAPHNTNVTDVEPPWGGYPKFISQGYNGNYLPVWMQEAGYSTYYVGKLMNAHTVVNYNQPVAAGWTGSDFLLDPTTYDYWGAKMSRNGAAPVSYAGQYSSDVVAEKVLGFMDDALKGDKPFFLVAAPVSPHGQIKPPPLWFDKPEYPERHAHLFKDYKIPRTSNFNPETPSGAGWIAAMPRLNQTQIDYHDEYQRCRLRSLQSVDEMVGDMIEKLKQHDELDNTYFIYTTDNGFHISQYRLPPGKTCGFDTDIRIPMVARGPGVGRNKVNDDISSHTDFAATFLAIAGQKREDLDGVAIPLSKNLGKRQKTEHTAVEFWGVGRTEGIYDPFYTNAFKDQDNNYINNTYKAVRLIGKGYNLYYSVWCSNEKEYYDVSADPGQIKNLATSPALAHKHSIRGRPYDQIVNRLDALMMVTKSCKGSECVEPWNTLHPQGNVKDLKDALHPKYDDFYKQQPKVSFSSCELGYIKEVEGPQDVNAYRGRHPHDKREPEYGGHWSYWV
ncbi:hypothetical protein UREG_07890 [Uncinocarpus reesii 1704]|uniref:Arylsulfatase n=1 Tax=Uncinocarpus reesii (strain UAMH 1704) TaxID=336963 RepID=C4JXV2_UNCRE|nr:uncharacterized protein UREG_07890 [Uncinocarpus reesii 1704]EEP83025.1 hypothetical protein UREG_07890 [Uncinocarpus reesii 1704]